MKEIIIGFKYIKELIVEYACSPTLVFMRTIGSVQIAM